MSKDMKQRIKKAYDTSCPDVLECILEKCESERRQKNMKKKRVISSIFAFAAIFAVIIGAVFFFKPSQSRESITSIVSIDVNPSIELGLNKNERVVKAKAFNDEGARILDGMNLSGTDVNVALNAIIGAMLRDGYLNEFSNSILLSVDGSDALRIELAENISKTLTGNSFNGSVLSQNIHHTEEARALAESSGISEAKAEYVNRVASNTTAYSKDELASLSINDLNLLTEASGLHVENVSVVGTASDKKYIGKERALDIVKEDMNVPVVFNPSIELELEMGTIVYKIYFMHNGIEYGFYVNAQNGSIVAKNKDVKNGVLDRIPKGDIIELDTVLTAEKAIEIALSHAGVEGNIFCEIESDFENEKCVFEIGFEHEKYEYEYEIDASTGEIIKNNREIDD